MQQPVGFEMEAGAVTVSVQSPSLSSHCGFTWRCIRHSPVIWRWPSRSLDGTRGAHCVAAVITTRVQRYLCPCPSLELPPLRSLSVAICWQSTYSKRSRRSLPRWKVNFKPNRTLPYASVAGRRPNQFLGPCLWRCVTDLTRTPRCCFRCRDGRRNPCLARGCRDTGSSGGLALLLLDCQRNVGALYVRVSGGRLSYERNEG
jgi:hypothetical protein